MSAPAVGDAAVQGPVAGGGCSEKVGTIQALSKATVRLIGSAQVITSVVSVVKELVENSLDAGSSSIEIKLENYGFDKIEVRDNGDGIQPSDTPYMGRAHHTSKLSNIDGLGKLQTYGFRGEALGSLCAVSRVTITTKTVSDDIGMVYELDQEGSITNKRPSHLGQGTTVCAAQLFHSVPVRRQYYSVAKRRKEELKKVEDLIMAFGLIKHEVRFVLRHNREVIWQKSTVPSFRQVLSQILGSATMVHMEHRQNKDTNSKVGLEICVPKKDVDVHKTSRTSSDRSFIFINGRPVINKDILKLIKQSYTQATGCDGGRYPVCFISLVIPPEDIDVNLEPNKTKVLLQDNKDILGMLKELMADIYPCKEPVSPGTHLDESSSVGEDTNISLISCDRNSFGDENSFTGNAGFGVQSVKVGSRTDYSAIPDPGLVLTPRQDVHGKAAGVSTGSSSKQTAAQIVQSDDSFLNKDPLLNSTRCDGEGPVVNSQNITFNLEFDKESDDIFRDLDMVEEKDATSSFDLATIRGNVSNAVQSKTDLPNLPSVPMCGTTKNCVIDRPGNTTEKNIALQGRVSNSASMSLTMSDKGRTEANATNNAVSSWSKGNLIDTTGENKLAPVQLLIPGAPPPTHQTTPRRPTGIDISAASSTNRSRLAADKPGQMTLADVAAMDHIKQPTSAFIEFSKQKRPALIKMHPDAELKEIGKLIAGQWNKLTEEEQESYANMRAHSSLIKDFGKKETSPSYDGPNSKKRKIINNGNNLSVQEMWNSPKPAPVRKKLHRAPRKTISVSFSMSKLQKRYCEGPVGSQCYKQSPSLELVGEVKPAGWWVGLHGSSIMALVPWRMQECLIFHQLMESHSLPTEKLVDPIHLNLSNIGEEYLNFLHALQSSTPRPTDIYTYCTDPRIIRSGFSIRKSIGTDPSLDIISMTRCIPLFGLPDLLEIINRLNKSPGSTVRDSRPLKVMHYLQGEAVRMVRQMPPRMNREEVEDAVKQLRQKLPKDTTECFHQRPFIHKLYNLDEIKSSQVLQVA